MLGESERAELETLLGYRFALPEHLERALTHRSFSQEAGQGGADNERLEFLGDAIVGFVCSEYLVERFPQWKEGQLSKGRARLVSRPSLAAAARRLNLHRYLLLSRGEEKTGGRQKQALLADVYEALAAAIYVDGGLAPAADFIRRTVLEPAVREQAAVLGQSDHKSALQEWLQARGRPPAEYRTVGESGPDHRKTFRVAVYVDGRELAASEGPSKKQAEQAAARDALEQLCAVAPSGKEA